MIEFRVDTSVVNSKVNRLVKVLTILNLISFRIFSKKIIQFGVKKSIEIVNNHLKVELI